MLFRSMVWYIGAVVLYIKSISLLFRAETINPEQDWIWLAVLSGFVIGGIKAKYLFKPLCCKNLTRINSLQQAQLWQFYRVHFFVFLFSMISLGGFLSRLAQDNYQMLITLAIIELSIATALLGSSNCFWKE